MENSPERELERRLGWVQGSVGTYLDGTITGHNFFDFRKVLQECLRLQAEAGDTEDALNKAVQYVYILETFWGIPSRIENDMNVRTKREREELVAAIDKVGLALPTPESEVGKQ